MRFPKPSSSFKAIRALLWPLIVAVIGAIIVDLYLNRVALELQLLAQSRIVEGTGLEKLQVSYDKREIPALSSLERKQDPARSPVCPCRRQRVRDLFANQSGSGAWGLKREGPIWIL